MHSPRSTRVRWAIVSAATALLGLAAPAVASASDWAPVKLTAVGKAYGVISDSNSTRLAITCAAQGSDAFASVGITQCYTTNGAFAPALTLPGTTAATANVKAGTTGGYLVCVEAKGRLILGSAEVTAPLHCEPSVLGVGVTHTTA